MPALFSPPSLLDDAPVELTSAVSCRTLPALCGRPSSIFSTSRTEICYGHPICGCRPSCTVPLWSSTTRTFQLRASVASGGSASRRWRPVRHEPLIAMPWWGRQVSAATKRGCSSTALASHGGLACGRCRDGSGSQRVVRVRVGRQVRGAMAAWARRKRRGRCDSTATPHSTLQPSATRRSRWDAAFCPHNCARRRPRAAARQDGAH